MESEDQLEVTSVGIGMAKNGAIMLATLILAAGCSSDPSEKQMESWLLQAKMEKDAGLNQKAEAILLKCLNYSDKESYIRLAALNQLVEVEENLKNSAKSLVYLQEAGEQGEAVSRSGTTTDTRVLYEAKAAIFRWADKFTEKGSVDSARNLYQKARILELRGAPTSPADSVDIRLEQLSKIERKEQFALTHQYDFTKSSEQNAHARMQRTKARKELMFHLKALCDEIVRKPGKKLADEMLDMLPKILTAYGIREVEYRSALHNATHFSMLYGQKDKAIKLIEADLANFDKFSQADIDNADPTTIENISFVISDLSHLANFHLHDNEFQKADDCATRGINLAQRVKSLNSETYAECLRVAAMAKECLHKRAEALPLRKKQIEALTMLNHTEKYLLYDEAHFELARSLLEAGSKEDALKHINIALAGMEKYQPDAHLTADAYSTKGEILSAMNEREKAWGAAFKSFTIWKKIGTIEEKYQAYSKCGKLALDSNKPAMAMEMSSEALRLAAKLPVQIRDQRIVDSNRQLAHVNLNVGKRRLGFECFDRALKTQIKLSGKNGVPAAGILNEMASVAADDGRNVESEELHLRAIAACRSSYPPDPIALISTLIQTADFYQRTGKAEKSIKLYSEALSLAKGRTDTDSKNMLRINRVHLGQSFLMANKEGAAVKTKDQSLAEASELEDGNPASDCDYYLVLGDFCMQLRDFSNAEVCYDKCLRFAGNNQALKGQKQVALSRKEDLKKVRKNQP